jgi:hypothetical protein
VLCETDESSSRDVDGRVRVGVSLSHSYVPPRSRQLDQKRRMSVSSQVRHPCARGHRVVGLVLYGSVILAWVF